MALSVETAKRRLKQDEAKLNQVQTELSTVQNQFNQEISQTGAKRGTAEYLALRQKYNLASLEAQVETMQVAVSESKQELTTAENEAAAEAASTAQQHTFSVSRQSTTGLLILTDTTTGKIVARAETPYDLVNIAVQKGAVPENQRQELISQGQAFVQEDDAKQAQQNTAQSAGQEVKQSGDAGATNPPQPNQVLEPDGRINRNDLPGAGSNADTPKTTDTAADAGLANETKPITETQAVNTPPGQGSQLPDPSRQQANQGNDARPTSNYGPGVGQGNDDASPTKNATRQDIELSFQEDIYPQPNILDDYASYTYQLSWYLLNNDDYVRLLQSGRDEALTRGGVGIDGGQLLMQSGGAQDKGDRNETIDGQTATVRDRNPYFKLDYYIDSLTLKSLLPGNATGTATTSTDFKMTVIEPNGITLVDNLKKAIKSYAGLDVFPSALYCLVIRFRGYDENGNPVIVGKTDSGGAKTDPYSIVVKYIPFAITKLEFSVSNRLTTYDITAAVVQNGFRLRQTVPFETELTGRTVSEMLGGQKITTSNSEGTRTNTTSQASGGKKTSISPRSPGTGASGFPLKDGTDPSKVNTTVKAAPSVNAPGTAVSAPQGTNTPVRGLMQAMNEYQQDLVKKGIYEKADEYIIEFANNSIANATVKKPGNLAIDATPMNASTDARKQLDETNQMLSSQRNFAIRPGGSLVQAIEMVVRNSSYITDQQLNIIDEETQQEKPNGTPIKTFAWFKISLKAEPLGNMIDRKRGDYAYRFTFLISIYESKSMLSPWFPRTQFRGVHKTYPYWFTGQNTAVLEYQQSFNNYYFSVLSGTSDAILTDFTSNYNDMPRFVYQPNSGQSSQGAEGRTNEPAANAAEYLYSPKDIAKVKMKILGDPAWIMQGEIYRGLDPATFNFSAFNQDGTINFDSQEILFEIVWQRPVDYDINGTGLMNPNKF